MLKTVRLGGGGGGGVTSVNGKTGVVVLVPSDIGAAANTTNVLASGLLSGGGALTGNVTLSLTSVPVANVPGAVPNTVNVLTSGLASGGGPLTGNVTINVANVPVANITGLGTMATQNANNVNITGGTMNASMNVYTSNLQSNVAASATMSSANLPLAPAGYINFNLNGTIVKIPYYAV